MTIKITIPNTSSDTLTFGSANTPTAAQIAGIDSGSSNGQLALYTTASGTSTERVRVDASGKVGIGTSSPASQLSFGANIGRYFALYEGAGGSDLYGIGTESSALTFKTAAAERARITSGGDLLVGTTTSIRPSGFGTFKQEISAGGQGLFIAEIPSGNSGITTKPSSGVTSYFPVYFLNASETAVGYIQATTTATVFSTTSDYRLKNTVVAMTGALAKVALLKPCTYKWNADGSNGQGFIAHELAEVCPDAVTGEKDAVNADGSIKPQGIDTSFLVATLTAAIQEQQALITQLQADVAALKGASA
jgi:hypothetical protein